MEAIQSHDQEQAKKNYEEAATLSAKLLNLFDTDQRQRRFQNKENVFSASYHKKRTEIKTVRFFVSRKEFYPSEEPKADRSLSSKKLLI